MLIEIDENALNDELKSYISTDDKGNHLDISKLKTQGDVDRVMQAKRNADNELAAYKEKYKRS